ncbi:hypothetical protein BCR33DRAFT_715102 [Rhizoclosmatium globosum]|uniref:Uncharacterized protein n=1 Tax=Rhizoclosmatium globosum TaxID=329046 RepID=A0A1Y2CK39_9FUNG|nr:hypothetical protein BCR33DRAFT_715102 [Rhizoclosmatium globosum]|eukprot:ORY47372.1 hypothetical protein BCR33DRAFT_715102 [Rhizoclosmatium globosum]
MSDASSNHRSSSSLSFSSSTTRKAAVVLKPASAPSLSTAHLNSHVSVAVSSAATQSQSQAQSQKGFRPSQLILDLRAAKNASASFSASISSSATNASVAATHAAHVRAASSVANPNTNNKADKQQLQQQQQHRIVPSSLSQSVRGLNLRPTAVFKPKVETGSSAASTRFIKGRSVKDAASQSTETYQPSQYDSVDWTFMQTGGLAASTLDTTKHMDCDFSDEEYEPELCALNLDRVHTSKYPSAAPAVTLTPISNAPSSVSSSSAVSPTPYNRCQAPDADRLMENLLPEAFLPSYYYDDHDQDENMDSPPYSGRTTFRMTTPPPIIRPKPIRPQAIKQATFKKSTYPSSVSSASSSATIALAKTTPATPNSVSVVSSSSTSGGEEDDNSSSTSGKTVLVPGSFPGSPAVLGVIYGMKSSTSPSGLDKRALFSAANHWNGIGGGKKIEFGACANGHGTGVSAFAFVSKDRVV